jgi:hypothetical protein
MRIVAALGGNALLERGEPPESEIQEKHIIKAVSALAPLAREHAPRSRQGDPASRFSTRGPRRGQPRAAT